MDTLKSIITLMKPNCFMSTIDLKDAYYSVPINEEHQKYLKFCWKGNYFKFVCFPNGLSFCPRKFTKLLKPAHAYLRLLGHVLAGYIDDNYIQGDSYEDAVTGVLDTVQLFSDLGFFIHPKKSSLIPSQKIEHLGFVLNSVDMTVRLTDSKTANIKATVTRILKANYPSIRNVASLIGLLVSSFPAVMFGPLFYRNLERDKSLALKLQNYNYDGNIVISEASKSELQWWIDNLDTSFGVISHGQPNLFINSDASKTGWGGVCSNVTCGGHWTPLESENHINYLELKAAFFVLKAFVNEIRDKHVRIQIDNTSAVSIINHMGTSHSDKCNSIAHDIWKFCIHNNTWLSASYIPGIENVIADKESRCIETNTEWMINPSLLKKAFDKLNVYPNIDMFASRINKQFHDYIAYRPDPEAYAIDAFSVKWDYLNGYYFPPFSLLSRVLQKLEEEHASAVVVLPKWPTQVWFSKAMRLLINHPVLLTHDSKLLTLPSHPYKIHPLHKKLDLLVCHLSGKISKREEFQKKLWQLSYTHGGSALKNSTDLTLKNGNCSVIPQGLIQFQPL